MNDGWLALGLLILGYVLGFLRGWRARGAKQWHTLNRLCEQLNEEVK